MNIKHNRKPPIIHIVIAEDDPLRLIGFRTLFASEPDLEFEPLRLLETVAIPQVDVILVSDHGGHNLAERVDQVKAMFPNTRILITGPSLDETVILEAIVLGAKGYVSETTVSSEFAKAIRIVNQGLIWAPRRVLALLIGRAADHFMDTQMPDPAAITGRQKEVLKMLVTGRSNKEIAAPLGIEERTVKAHVAQLMRKLGARNRIMLSVHAVTHSIV